MRPQPGRPHGHVARFLELRAAPGQPLVAGVPHVPRISLLVFEACLQLATTHTRMTRNWEKARVQRQPLLGSSLACTSLLQEWMTRMSEKRRSRRTGRCCCSN